MSSTAGVKAGINGIVENLAAELVETGLAGLLRLMLLSPWSLQWGNRRATIRCGLLYAMTGEAVRPSHETGIDTPCMGDGSASAKVGRM
jgi:hypothetical protein